MANSVCAEAASAETPNDTTAARTVAETEFQVGIIVTRSCRRAAAARVAALPIAITRPETRASDAIAHRKNGCESRVLMALVARDYSES